MVKVLLFAFVCFFILFSANGKQIVGAPVSVNAVLPPSDLFSILQLAYDSKYGQTANENKIVINGTGTTKSHHSSSALVSVSLANNDIDDLLLKMSMEFKGILKRSKRATTPTTTTTSCTCPVTPAPTPTCYSGFQAISQSKALSAYANSSQYLSMQTTGAANYQQVFVYSQSALTIKLASNTTVCLDSYRKVIKAGNPVIMYPCTGGTNEQWTFSNAYSGSGTVTTAIRPNSNSNLCLSTASTSTVSGLVLAACSSGSATQTFTLTTTTCPSASSTSSTTSASTTSKSTTSTSTTSTSTSTTTGAKLM